MLGGRAQQRTTKLFFVVALGVSFAAGCGSPSVKVTDSGADVPTEATTCPGGSATPKPNGQACVCQSDCQSGFCVDGLCCDTKCDGSCQTCRGPESPGKCSPVPSGAAPRLASDCPKGDVTACGLDGTCDGAGACRKYAAGTVCRAGACDGTSVTGGQVCDGNGHCKAGPTTVCSPFQCDTATNTCLAMCTSDADCAGTKCVAGSCGLKLNGAMCKKGPECASGFCADGVCCNVACAVACVSCDQVGRAGTCWPLDRGQKDKHGGCVDGGAPSCGRTGACDGLGGCSLYAAETICAPPSCAGSRLNTAATCDGKGACRAPGVQNCWPYNCSNDACAISCKTDDECQAGHACVNGSCGPKPLGQSCQATTDCASGFCVDGVCCDGPCGGACLSCALPSAMGRCTPSPASTPDPRGVCMDKGKSSCSTNGLCDGLGGCQTYKAGTACADERCTANVYTGPSTCDGAGQCVTPSSLPCAPFACNGSRCFSSCGGSGDCVAPNTCVGGSCGKKPIGSFCSDGSECVSSFCAQGVCCATACGGTCRSCALATSMGQCTNVATGAPDPSGTCVAQGSASCGTNGMCDAGACQKYPQGTPCAGATCPASGTTYTGASACDGAGACVTPAATSCAPFKCGDSVCKATCASDADCVSPSVCSDGSCGLKSPGAACSDGTECATGICAQGACCRTACAGTCQSCAVATAPGTCSPVLLGGADPSGTCKDQGATSCGTTGACDGQGACQLYAGGTTCAPATCPTGATTEMLARTCDGAGTCRAATALPCAPFACNGVACNTTCVGDGDCAAPNICDVRTNLCGDKKRLGQACATSAECLSGNFCVDGVCCSTSACGTCLACNVSGREGACSDVPPSQADPHGRCTAAPPCGLTGACDGAGSCQNAPTTTSCGTASCTGSTSTPTGFCNGAGACAQHPLSCSPFNCGGNGACNTTCGGDGDCVPGSSCVGGACTSLRTNGTACAMDLQCLSGHCVEGVCCGAASCAVCTSCAVAGSAGTCTPVAAGVVCGPAMCKGKQNLAASSACDGKGVCAAGAQSSCTPFACASGACKTTCAGDADCAPSKGCNVATGACQ